MWQVPARPHRRRHDIVAGHQHTLYIGTCSVSGPFSASPSSVLCTVHLSGVAGRSSTDPINHLLSIRFLLLFCRLVRFV